jgi:hypothetical protein
VQWSEKILHSFGDGNDDGQGADSNLLLNSSGNLDGTTYAGGTYGKATAFALTPTASGNWAETVLHSFDLNGEDEIIPYAGLIADGSGNLYSTTGYGGTSDDGTVFVVVR